MKTHFKNHHSSHHNHKHHFMAENSQMKKHGKLDHFQESFSEENASDTAHQSHPESGRRGHFFGRGRGLGHRGSFKQPFGRGDHFPAGRKFSSHELQLMLLALLEKKAAHGYELIRQLEALSDGFYVPSPGMVYPALTYLSEIGHADIELEGSRKLYSLTDGGQDYLDSQRQQANEILESLEKISYKMDEIREAFSGEADTSLSNASLQTHRLSYAPESLPKIMAIRQAYNRLRSVLKTKHSLPPEGLEKIMVILAKTIAEISDIA